MLAEQGPACAAGQFLIGYRKSPGAMSRDVQMMAASRQMARRLHKHACPHVIPPRWLDRWIRAHDLLVAAKIDWSAGRTGRALLMLGRALLADPAAIAVALSNPARSWVRTLGRRPQSGQISFLELDPCAWNGDQPGDHPRQNPFMRLQLRRLERLAVLDR